ncbi:MAG: response regulator [Nitrospirota bacterium]|nr:response regulator [Nitrospirota bacterium]
MRDALDYFRIEAREHLEGLNSGLLEMERATADAATVNRLFRLAHTLKGAARMVGQDGIGTLAHKVEDVLVALRDGSVQAKEELISTLLEVLETIADMVATLGEVEAQPAPGPLLESLEAVLAAAAVPPPKAKKTAPRRPRKSPRPRGVPSPPVSTEPVAMENPPSPLPPAAGVPVSETGHLRVAVDKVDVLANLTGELLMHRMRLAEENLRLRALTADALRVVRCMQDVRSWAETDEARTLLVGTAAGDTLKPILARARTTSLKEGLKGVVTAFRHQISQVDYAVSGLHERIMDLRMLPASTLSTMLRLVVRETCRELGRKANLLITGENIEMDKALLDGLREPLAHLLRNAIGHGIDPPEQRLATGKPPLGELQLNFRREGARLTVTLADDGVGINLAKVRELALEQGLVGASATPADLLRCLTLPGFSTAAAVTQVSGRGVGLDVVAGSVRAMDGTLEIITEHGQGTCVTMHLPLNLASMDGFLFTLAGRTMAVPMGHVVTVRQARPDDVGRCAGEVVLRVDGRAVPLVTVGNVHGAPAAPDTVELAMILRQGDEQVAVAVERVVGVRTLVVKPVPAHVGELPWVSGVTILADGLPTVILNVGQLFRATGARRGALQPAWQESQGPADVPSGEGAVAGTVLVVDDSLSARMMEKRVLETAGYRVVLAEDGREALQRLATSPVDLVVTDVEMPHLDGFGLVRRLREQDSTRHLPVIILSSLQSGREHKEGLSVGANAFVVKAGFKGERLVETVRRLLSDARHRA